MRTDRSLLAPLALVLLGGCSGEKPAQPAAAPTAPAPSSPEGPAASEPASTSESTRPAKKAHVPPAKAAAATPSLTVTLLEPGAEPRAALRLHPTAGAAERLAVTLHVEDTLTFSGHVIPRPPLDDLELALTALPKAVEADGAVAFELSVVDARADAPPAKDRVRTKVDEILARLAVTRGAAKVSATGRPLEGGLDAVAPTKDATGRVAGSYLRALQNLAVALPDEAVGAGARWRVERALPNVIPGLVTTATYTLEKREGDVLTLAMTVAATVPPGAIDFPGAPAGATLEKYDAEGSGALTLDLGHLLPTQASASYTSDTLLILPAKGDRVSKVALKASMTLSSAPAEPQE
ncbi:MAG: hypothetical protein H6745_19070 [Deltaproteobacteria bacterium]|nr:hypothetical protein [Deltaproteobacteria bacterium]